MIGSYKDKKTKKLAEGEMVRQFEPFRHQAEKRLRILDAATSTTDLAVCPAITLRNWEEIARDNTASG